MTLTLGSSSSINAQLALGIIGAIAFSALIIWLLVEIELSIIFKSVNDRKKRKKKKSTKSKKSNTDELSLEESEDTTATSAAEGEEEEVEDDEPAGETTRPRKLDRNQTLVIVAKVAIIVLLTYLLLVFLPSGLALSLLGLFSVVGALLRVSIIEEHRRQRYDRLSAMLTFLLLIASCMSISTFARLAAQEGPVYQGPARIIGYDDTSYNDDEGIAVKRADLEVSWGGEWACPEAMNYCAAFVNGALCEVDEDDYYDDGNRWLDGGNDEDADNGNGDQDNQEDGDQDNQEDGDQDANNEDGDQDANNEDGDQDANNEDAGDENDANDANEDLEEENEELEEENEELEEYNEALEEENEELEESLYDFDDDYFGDDFWVEDWSNIWGDYACNDLFDTDLEGMDYDADSPPGDDGWPFVNIYGSCKSCTAYLVDYYSTEHFKKIKSYQTQARNYMIAGLVSLLVTGGFMVKERISPSKENEIVLLTNEGGSIA